MSTELYNVAVGLLTRRDHSIKELRQKLTNKHASGFESEVVFGQALNTVIDKLVDQGYLDEQRFVASYARYRAGSGFGPGRIHMELKERGIDPVLIDATLDDLSSSIDWHEVLHRTWEKKFRQPPLDFPEKVKQMRFLSYRGFTEAQIHELLEGLKAVS